MYVACGDEVREEGGAACILFYRKHGQLYVVSVADESGWCGRVGRVDGFGTWNASTDKGPVFPGASLFTTIPD